ncbi:MAG: 5-formyltetrahydrofolate cyclo-ligase [Candidatus Sulfobium sp.]
MRDKKSIRKELLDKRDAIPTEVRKIKDRLICERVLSLAEVVRAHTLFLFASFRSEVDTFGIMRSSLAAGKKVLVPRVDRERHILFLCEIRNVDELVPGYMGIPEPPLNSQEIPADVNDIDLVIIPGAGFDPAGNRIGYGGGYYDRLLAGLKRDIPVVAPAYEEQIAGSIPAEPHDIRVTVIVTDRRVIRCGGSLIDND